MKKLAIISFFLALILIIGTYYTNAYIGFPPGNLISLVSCKYSHGEYKRAGISPYYTCIKKYSDGGKPCNRPNDCLGGCISDFEMRTPFRCKEDTNPAGAKCIKLVVNNKEDTFCSFAD